MFVPSSVTMWRHFFSEVGKALTTCSVVLLSSPTANRLSDLYFWCKQGRVHESDAPESITVMSFLHSLLVSVIHHLSDTKGCMSKSTGSAINGFTDYLVGVIGTSTPERHSKSLSCCLFRTHHVWLLGCSRAIVSGDGFPLLKRRQTPAPDTDFSGVNLAVLATYMLRSWAWRVTSKNHHCNPTHSLVQYQTSTCPCLRLFSPFTIATFSSRLPTCPAVTSFLVPAFAWMFSWPPGTPGIRVAFPRCTPNCFSLFLSLISLPHLHSSFGIQIPCVQTDHSGGISQESLPCATHSALRYHRTVRLQRRCCAARPNLSH